MIFVALAAIALASGAWVTATQSLAAAKAAVAARSAAAFRMWPHTAKPPPTAISTLTRMTAPQTRLSHG